MVYCIYIYYKNLSGETSHISVTSGYLSQLAAPLPPWGTGRDATGGAEEATRTAGGQNGGPTLEPFEVGKVAILTLKQNNTWFYRKQFVCVCFFWCVPLLEWRKKWKKRIHVLRLKDFRKRCHKVDASPEGWVGFQSISIHVLSKEIMRLKY